MLHSLVGKKILMVEDEPAMREAIAWMLDVLGATVTHARDGKQALELYQQQPYDRVITDYMMATMRGDALAEAIKTINPTQRVIMISGFGAKVLENGKLPWFIDALLPKPCTLDELANVLE